MNSNLRASLGIVLLSCVTTPSYAKLNVSEFVVAFQTICLPNDGNLAGVMSAAKKEGFHPDHDLVAPERFAARRGELTLIYNGISIERPASTDPQCFIQSNGVKERAHESVALLVGQALGLGVGTPRQSDDARLTDWFISTASGPRKVSLVSQRLTDGPYLILVVMPAEK